MATPDQLRQLADRCRQEYVPHTSQDLAVAQAIADVLEVAAEQLGTGLTAKPYPHARLLERVDVLGDRLAVLMGDGDAV